MEDLLDEGEIGVAEVGLVVGEAEVASLDSTVDLPWDSWEELHCGGGVWGGGGGGEREDRGGKTQLQSNISLGDCQMSMHVTCM